MKQHELRLSHQYLNFPVKDGAPKRKVRFRVGDKVLRFFDIEWADADPDFWVFTDVTAFSGERLTIEIDEVEHEDQDASSPGDLKNLAAFIHSDTIEGGDDLYREKFRPQFHFTSRRGWLNDPNGLLYYRGTYHLFYQHNPFGRQWGNMHWGHATSSDLVHWEEHTDVLYPDEMGSMFSGTGVVDWHNSSGLQKGSGEALICFYTAAGDYAEPKVPFTQCLMFSDDGGQSWQKYEDNPVIPAIAAGTRDPAVTWDPESQAWLMALYITVDKTREHDPHHYALFRSSNLRDWEQVQDLFFPGMGECPDFFPLALDGNPRQRQWVFWTADGHYVVGQFNGNTFTSETEVLQSTYSAVRHDESTDLVLHGGYAAQTWRDIPPEDARRIQIAWLTGDIPEMPFNQQMTFPVELTLRSTESGPRLHSWPIKEIALLYQEQQVHHNIELSDSPYALPTDDHDLLDIQTEIEVGDAGELEFNLRGITVVYDVIKQEISCLERTAAVKPIAGRIHLRVLLDRASIEIFSADGLAYLPISVKPEESNTTCTILVRGGPGVIKEMKLAKLNASWVQSGLEQKQRSQ